MDVTNGEYSFFNPRIKNRRGQASLIFSLVSSFEISAHILLIRKKYSEIVILPWVVIVKSFFKYCSLAVFVLKNNLSRVSQTCFGKSISVNKLLANWRSQGKQGLPTFYLLLSSCFGIIRDFSSNICIYTDNRFLEILILKLSFHAHSLVLIIPLASFSTPCCMIELFSPLMNSICKGTISFEF